MKNVKDIVSFVIIALWVVLFLVLTVRFPVADMLSDSITSMETTDDTAVVVDNILSYAIGTVGILSGIVGVIIKRRELIALSLVQAGIILLSVILCGIAFVTLNDAFLKYMLYLLNPFTAFMYLPVFWALVFTMISTLFPVATYIIYKIKHD